MKRGSVKLELSFDCPAGYANEAFEKMQSDGFKEDFER